MTNAPVFRAADFLNTLGVDTHIPYTDGGYANISNVTADLAYIGLKHVRDGIGNGLGGDGQLASMIKLAQQGVTFTLCIVDGSVTSTAGLNAKLALVQRLIAAVPGCVTAIEGANEINNWPVTFNGVGGLQGAVNLQKAIYSAVHGNPAFQGVAVDYFTGYAAGNVGVGPNPSTTPGLADYDTQHPYPNFGQAPGFWIDPATAVANEAGARGPLVYTETGYSSNGGTWGAVDQPVQAKYTLDLLFDAMKDGVSQVDLYELMDAYANGSPQGNAGFGLFDTSNKPKLVATAIHNLTTILADTGTTATTFQTKAIAPTITGLPATGQSMVLEKSNGVFDVVVWAEPKIWDMTKGAEVAAPTQAVTVDLGAAYGSIAVFDPLTGTTAVNTLTNARFVQVGVTDHPLIIEVGPALAPPAVAITAQMLSPNVGASTASTASGNGPVTMQGTYTGAAGTTVMMFDGTTALGQAALGAGGTWTYTTTLAAGTHALTAVATDCAGNSASCAAAPPITVASTPPVVAITAQVLAQDTGASATDNITSNGAVTLSGTVAGAQGTTVTVFDGATALGTATLGQAGSWSYATTLGSGTHALTAVATDPAGNRASSGGAPAITVATSAPAVAITAERLAQDTGASATDNITSNGAVTLSGTVAGAQGTTVTVFDGATALGTAALGQAGTWTYATTLGAGAHALTAVATDLAGNRSTTLAAAPITVTTGAPVIKVGAATLGADGTTETVTGTLSGPAGTTVTLANGTSSLGTATLDGKGGWSYTGRFAPGPYALTATATDTAGNTASATPSFTVPAPVVSAPVAALKPAAVPAVDSLVVNVSEDAYKGDAQFMVSVDGMWVGGVQTATASHSLGQSQAVTLNGKFGAGVHTVGVYYLNDLNGGSPAADRNLYVDSITLNGAVTTTASLQGVSGLAKYLIGTPATTTDTLALDVSEDAYLGDAQFTVSVDGQQVGGVQTVTASHAAGQSQRVTLAGNFGTGSHTIGVNFVNDLWGGSAAQDRNLYVKALTYDATTTVLNTAQALGGLASYTVAAPVTSPDLLSLQMSEDAYKGDAQFTVSVDGKQVGGVQTVSASHGSGQTQTFNLSGSFGTGSHVVGVNFLNDLWGGSVAADRNLYVKSATLDGTTTLLNAGQNSSGLANYTIQTPTTANAPAAAALALSVDAGTTLILDKDASAGAAVTFGGSTGTAQFTDATSFHGTITGFQAMDALDLRSVGFGATTAVDFAAGAGSGTLTVSDGSHTAHLALSGSYGPASFRAATDGQGGTLITLKV